MPLFGTNLLMIAAGVILFAAVMLIVLGVDSLLVQRRSLARRLQQPGEISPALGDGDRPRVVLEDDLLKRFADFLTPKDVGELTALRRWLVRGGYRNLSAARVYNLAKPVVGFVFLIGGFAFGSLLGKGLPPPVQLLIVPLIAGVIGWFLPFLWVERKV